MTAATVSRLGDIDLGGSDFTQLFLKLFAGEVLTAFEETVILKGMTRQRTITSGKSAQFPATFNTTTTYHTPGAELVGKEIRHNEVVIAVDDLLVSDVFIAEWDEAVNHYDVRAPYSNALGRALALTYDQNISRTLVASARGAALFTGDTGGQSVTDADGRTSATSLAASIWAAKQAMEEAEVPVEQQMVHAALLPAQWYLLAQEPTLILNRDVDGDGSYSRGTFSLIGGVDVSKSNSLRWGQNDSGLSTGPTKYKVDMTNTIAVVFTEDAAATVQLKGLALESERDIRRQGTLMVGKYAVGHGLLRSKCAVELKTA